MSAYYKSASALPIYTNTEGEVIDTKDYPIKATIKSDAAWFMKMTRSEAYFTTKEEAEKWVETCSSHWNEIFTQWFKESLIMKLKTKNAKDAEIVKKANDAAIVKLIKDIKDDKTAEETKKAIITKNDNDAEIVKNAKDAEIVKTVQKAKIPKFNLYTLIVKDDTEAKEAKKAKEAKEAKEAKKANSIKNTTGIEKM